MSVSSVGSSNPYSTLQWPQTGGTDSTDQSAASSDPLQALFQSISGGGSSDPLLAAIGQDDSSASSSGLQFSPDVMQALFSVQGDQPVGRFAVHRRNRCSASSMQTAMARFPSPSSRAPLAPPAPTRPRPTQLFSKIDANGDGSISTDEMQSAMQKAHGGGSPPSPRRRCRRVRWQRSVAIAVIERVGGRHHQPVQPPIRMARPRRH